MFVRRSAVGLALAFVTIGSIADASKRQYYSGQHCRRWNGAAEYHDYGIVTLTGSRSICPIVKLESDSVYNDADVWTSTGTVFPTIYEVDLEGDLIASFTATVETVGDRKHFDFPSITPLSASRLSLSVWMEHGETLYSYQLLDDSPTY